MAFVPVMVPNRRSRGYRNRSVGGIFAVLILLFIFGILFFVFFNHFDGVIMPIWIMFSGFSVFLIIIAVISAIAASMSETSKNPKEEYKRSYPYQPQKQIIRSNPYIIRNSIPKQSEEPINKQIEEEKPVITVINYCRYCGSKIERDAVFCHMCGTKL